MRRFRDLSDEIIQGWDRLRRSAERPESPNSWFKRNAYRLLSQYVEAGRQDVFEKLIARSDRHKVGLHDIRDNPFKLGLFAMYADASMSRNDRKIFAEQMAYAFRHGVPPELLIGFIRASGSPAEIKRKLDRGETEPGFNGTKA